MEPSRAVEDMSHKTEYANFAALRDAQRDGVNYKIHMHPRNSAVAIIAPHAGMLEPSTDRIATAIAANDFNLYIFEALCSADESRTLHITSGNFDEPGCVALVAGCDIVVAVHGLAEKAQDYVCVGGLDAGLRDNVCAHLGAAGFTASAVSSGAYAGTSPRNICNRGRRNGGVQIEITRPLRDKLHGDLLSRFAGAVRKAING
jgi:phage replication-related protein YjqB (UPF0714/DUF867 family)